MVVINQKNNLNFGDNNSPEITVNSNLKRWFSRNIGLWKSNRTYFLDEEQKTYNLCMNINIQALEKKSEWESHYKFTWYPEKKYNLNTNTNGEHRAFVVTGSFEEVFPLDIYPLQILKACMYKDLDEMEALGMYVVSPEDFALTEFICVSKQPHQNIIREGLDLMRKEIG